MVTKPHSESTVKIARSVLAKIHMVTKQIISFHHITYRSVLAKIHMVTKHASYAHFKRCGSVLAKIHMVTKL